MVVVSAIVLAIVDTGYRRSDKIDIAFEMRVSCLEKVIDLGCVRVGQWLFGRMVDGVGSVTAVRYAGS